ncbi:MAG: nucleotide exchange factor GrpE [Methanosarcinaceae archaeon]|nr:nucleotide exchange factor GrpE [Methanosarcinaceae archaeon]
MSKTERVPVKKTEEDELKNDNEDFDFDAQKPAEDGLENEFVSGEQKAYEKVAETDKGSVEEDEKKNEDVSEADKLKEQYLLLAADFDNFRKRSKRQMEETKKYANEDILESLIEVVDNLERALNAADETERSGSLMKGVENVHRQFLEKLETYGLKKVVAESGMEFDPKYHEAVICLPLKEGQKEGTICEVFLQGYELNGRLIRPAKVSVSEE